MTKIRRAIIMARVSSDEQAKGYSLDIQEENIRKWCTDNHVEVDKCFREDHSAKDFNRPQWKELKAYAKANSKSVDLLLVTTWDRFSRNTTDAFNELLAFKKLGIEVQSIQQPIDFNIPESKVLLAIYLTLPEVDNDRRSMKIREGIRAALKSGRWSRNAPIGYANSRDESNKPLIVPGKYALHIQYAFEQVAGGTSQQHVIKQLKEKGLTVSRNNLSLLLRNPVYLGKIRVPSSETEPEEIINGLHDAIVDNDIFIKVQEVLATGYKRKKKENSVKEELPLRGLLYCSCCGNKVTGSASRSKTGARHFYYHCNYCKKERYRAETANQSILDFLDELEFNKVAVDIYSEMVVDMLQNPDKKDKVDVIAVKEQIKRVEQKLDKLQDLLLDDVLSVHDYTRKKALLEKEMTELKSKILKESGLDASVKAKIKKGINLFTDAKAIYLKANVVEKQKLLSSIFPEKLEFLNLKCRTQRINDLLMLMLLINKGIGKKNTGQFFDNLELSRQVESPGIEPKFENLQMCDALNFHNIIAMILPKNWHIDTNQACMRTK